MKNLFCPRCNHFQWKEGIKKGERPQCPQCGYKAKKNKIKGCGRGNGKRRRLR